MLSFNVGSKQAFELALADISQATIQGKNEVVLEMHVDDTSGEHEVGTCSPDTCRPCLSALSVELPWTSILYNLCMSAPSVDITAWRLGRNNLFLKVATACVDLFSDLMF
jgi:hypothetical protein